MTLRLMSIRHHHPLAQSPETVCDAARALGLWFEAVLHAAAEVGINLIVTLEKKLLNMIVKLV